MLFVQTSAPTGWTKSTTHDNKALRVVSGTASSGGSVAFTTAFASGLSAGATTLSTSQIPAHNHGISDPGHQHVQTLPAATGGSGAAQGYNNTYRNQVNSYLSVNSSTTGISINNAGGGGSHDHTLPSFAVQYVDVIIATKD